MDESSAAGPRPPISAEKPVVVYLMGTARSGSTILGVALGNCAGIFYAGELSGWLEKSGTPRAFGGPERARFWARVREDVEDAGDLFGKQAALGLERSLSLLRIQRWPARFKLRRRYGRVAENLFQVIARTAGASHVVDSSSYPLRARELQRLAGIDLFLIYVVREPQSVVESFTRSDWSFSRSTLVTNAYLWLTSLLSVLVFLRQPLRARLFLRYEDFVADPEGVLRRILEDLDRPAAIPDLTALRIGSPFQGNRLLRRPDGVVALKRAPAERAQGTWRSRALQFPWPALQSRLRPAAGVPERK